MYLVLQGCVELFDQRNIYTAKSICVCIFVSSGFKTKIMKKKKS